MINTRIVKRYALALFGAIKQEQIEQVYQDLLSVQAIIRQSKDLRTFLSSPVVPHNKKQEIIKEIFGASIGQTALDFLLLIAEKRREGMLSEIIDSFEGLYNTQMNLLPVNFTTSVELDAELQQKLAQTVANITNKSVISDFKVDPALRGGAVVKIDDVVYDGSVRHHLEMLYRDLAGADMPLSLQNKLSVN
ncbi:MAG: ATP synthase F1 subunit delta [Ignavibacteriae bacterium]|nr:ATP synthase F1 subunit delta [Ignavibacteriota bacterium]